MIRAKTHLLTLITFCGMFFWSINETLGNDSIFNLVDTLVNNVNFEEALDVLLKLESTSDDPHELYQIHEYFGSIKQTLGKFDESLLSYKKALQYHSYLEEPDYLWVSDIYYMLANVFLYSNGDSVIQYCHQAIEILPSHDPKRIAKSYNLLGFIYMYRNEYDSTINYLHKASVIIDTLTENASLELAINNNFAILHYRKGEFDKALPYYYYSVEQNKILFGENSGGYLSAKNNYAVCLMNLGFFLDAINQFKEVKLKLQIRYGLTYHNLGGANTNIGTCYFKLEEFKTAVEYFQEALKIRNLNFKNNPGIIFKDLLNIADCLSKLGRYGEALKYYNQAIHFSSGSILRQAEITYNIGVLKYKQEEIDTALAYFDKALKILNIREDNLLESELEKWFPISIFLLDTKSRALVNKYDLDKTDTKFLDLANKYNRAALSWLDTLVVDYNEIESTARQTGKFRKLYENRINIDLKYFDLTRNSIHQYNALKAIIKSKNIQFNSILRDRLQDNNAEYNLLLKEHRIIQDSISKLNPINTSSDLLSVGSSKKLIELKSQLYEVRDSLNKIINQTVTSSDESIQNLIKKVQQKLANEDKATLLVNYFLGDAYLFILGITKSKVFIQKKIIYSADDQMEQDLQAFISYFNSADTSRAFYKFKKLSNQLYKGLLAVIDSIEDYEKLIIIPDGLISYIPFGSLIEEQNLSKSYRDQEYLIKNKKIIYNYSLDQYVSNQRNSKPKRYIGFAPFTSNNLQNKSDELLLFRDSIYALPNSWKEVSKAEKLWDGIVLRDSLATKNTFLQMANNYNIVHLATHAYITDNPNLALSGIAFNSVEGKEILTLAEAIDAEISPQLLILNGCNTGYGKLTKGEGIINFGRAFTQAGSQSIFMNLWKGNDLVSEKLISSFLKHLRSNKTKSASLRSAKLELINNVDNEHFADPYYWSGFIVMGNDEAIESKKRIWHRLVVGILVMFLITLLWRLQIKGKFI